MSKASFPVDIEDILTVGDLKEAIVKKKQVAFANVDPDDLDLWQVSSLPLFPAYAYNFARYPSRSTGNSKMMLAAENFSIKIRYSKDSGCRKSFRHPVLLRRLSTLSYDHLLVSRLLTPSLHHS